MPRNRPSSSLAIVLLSALAGFAAVRAWPETRQDDPNSNAAVKGAAVPDRSLRESRSSRPEAKATTATFRVADLKGFLQESRPELRTRRLLNWLDRLPLEDFPKAAAAYPEVSEIVEAWADHDPEAAADFAFSLDNYSGSLATATEIWTRKTPEAAEAWAKKQMAQLDQSSAYRSEQILKGLAAGLASHDPAKARMAMLSFGRKGQEQQDTVFKQAIARGMPYAENWLSEAQRELKLVGIKNQVSDFVRETLLPNRVEEPDKSVSTSIPRMANIANVLAKVDPDAAYRWGLTSDLAQIYDRSRIVGEIARTITKNNPEQALKWARSQSLQIDQSEALTWVARTQYKSDPQGTREWLTQMGDDPLSIGPRHSFVSYSYRENPADAADMILQCEPSMQFSCMAALMNWWSREDAEAAEIWRSEHSSEMPETPEDEEDYGPDRWTEDYLDMLGSDQC